MGTTTYHQEIFRIDDQTIRAECGPMRLTIQALENGKAGANLACRAAEVSFRYLESIAESWKTLRRPAHRITDTPTDRLTRQMIHSACAIGDDDLTPMAAVAGTISNAVAAWIYRHGGSKVVVDNGGDIALRLAGNESVTVGVRTSIRQPDISHVLKLNASRSSWGVTTSGFGGRSLSRGIASAVTVVADQASVADAAATAIANACTVEDMAIVRVPAEQIDPNTDLPGVEVTVEIGPLSPEKKRKAMDRAFQKAEALVRKKVIIGALIALDDQVMITDKMSALMITGNVESIARKQQRQKEEEK